jgi:hypothetical protein
MKFIYLIIFLSFNSFARDHHDTPWWAYGHNLREYSRVCIRERWIPLNVETAESPCFVSKELRLTEGRFHYPNIHSSPLKVRYWEGQIAKMVSTRGQYKHVFTNICEGGITYSEIRPHTQTQMITTDLHNPNLDLTISESYNLLPITKSEAVALWEDMKVKCGL